ncbi:DoxX family protein [Actinoplanes sp. KI2]|uniref:DoxX family protein n=1 Tax=Actinoplanes sp. KI2 TaxID=2983315 RepID=UPI0021D5865E|nr:DoxX family protein [Actinoplanes sp. KI2]MCU7725473.1 DoxX family protein [Actinoplanes sp. KI2]
MNIALWIVAAVLAVLFLASGVQKLATSRANLARTMRWADHFSTPGVKAIGVAEVLAAIGLIVPAALGIAPILVPLAATGLVLLMTGAIVTHLRLHERQPLAINLTLLALAALVAWARFGPHGFPS